ncbi:MAG: sugar ABC transporter permease [Thermosipho sp. (in: Bacteria)]|nr:sugar ABC transporter permease [Thermosipho sp. (in: thermotogales)]MCD6105062.1 sugar ABC transporter permease [Thermosipho sp. (in: thermotogales)]
MRKTNYFHLLMIIPATVVLLLTLFYPIVNTIIISFFDKKLFYPSFSTFVGLSNYKEILSNEEFWSAFKITIYFTIVSVFLEFVIGLFTAILLNQNFKLRGFLRTLVILPWAIPTVVNGVLWQWIFDSNYGSLNGLLYQLGLIHNYVNWLGKPFMALNMVIIADVWKNCWFFTIVLLGALQTIPKNYYDAAKVDGAGFWNRLFNVTLPLLRPAIVVSLVLRTSEAFKVFDIIYIMTKGGPANGTQVLSYYVYHTSFEAMQLGKGAALSTIIAIIILLIALVYIKSLMREEVEINA